MSSSAALKIVPATENDVGLILEFVKELAAYEKHLDRLETNEARIRETIFGAAPVASVIFAWNGDTPVGFAVFYYTYSTFAGQVGLYLEDLFVKSDFRGKGVGRKLLRHLAQVAKDEGCWRIEWAVLHWNESAIRFYENLGAVLMDEWAVYRLSGAELERMADGL